MTRQMATGKWLMDSEPASQMTTWSMYHEMACVMTKYVVDDETSSQMTKWLENRSTKWPKTGKMTDQIPK